MLIYDLPKELIAQQPCEPRDAARLMVVNRKSVPGTEQAIGTWYQHRTFRDLPDLLKPGDCLVLNDTKVLPARIYGRKAITGGKVELLLLSEGQPEGEKARIYRCLGQPAKNLKPGTRLQFNEGKLHAEVLSWENGERLVRFEGRGVEQVLNRLGEMPLPPYIDRPARPEDADWYQTVYAREPGAVAAPTAGLHFTPELLEKIRQKSVRIATITLHIGWGTFKPVGEKELAEGKLHPERFHIPEETAEAITKTKESNGRVIAVGTTVVRTLETAMSDAASQGGHAGCLADAPGMPGRARREAGAGTVPASLEVLSSKAGERWPSAERSAASLGRHERCEAGRPGAAARVEGMTDLFIRPGFKFQVVDALVTNFHLPGTSLLLMVSAFAGEERIRAAYVEAVNQKYRFYSYGDAMLIF